MKRHFGQRMARKRRVSLKYAGGDMILVYRLTEKPVKCRYSQNVFSLSVTQISGGGRERETVYLEDIARNEEDALYVFDAVSRGAVTPCTAAETVSDLIGIPR